jgi:hypothetical protein
MRSDDRGHHRLAGQFDPGRSLRHHDPICEANASDHAAFHHNAPVLDRQTAVAGDHASALKNDRLRRSGVYGHAPHQHRHTDEAKRQAQAS